MSEQERVRPPEFMRSLLHDLRTPNNPKEFVEAVLGIRTLLRRMYQLIPREGQEQLWNELSIRGTVYLVEALPPPIDMEPSSKTAQEIIDEATHRLDKLTEEEKRSLDDEAEEVKKSLREEFGEDFI